MINIDWLSLSVGAIGAAASFAAFVQASGAKRAAFKAGNLIKKQTIAIEMQDCIYKLQRIRQDAEWGEISDVQLDIKLKIRRFLANLKKEDEFVKIVNEINDAVDLFENNIEESKPTIDKADIDVMSQVYWAVRNPISKLSGLLADLIGLLEDYQNREVHNG